MLEYQSPSYMLITMCIRVSINGAENSGSPPLSYMLRHNMRWSGIDTLEIQDIHWQCWIISISEHNQWTWPWPSPYIISQLWQLIHSLMLNCNEMHRCVGRKDICNCTMRRKAQINEMVGKCFDVCNYQGLVGSLHERVLILMTVTIFINHSRTTHVLWTAKMQNEKNYQYGYMCTM